MLSWLALNDVTHKGHNIQQPMVGTHFTRHFTRGMVQECVMVTSKGSV